MRKSHLLFAAGTAIFLCGCPTTKPIANNKPVIPAPEFDPPAATVVPVEAPQPAVQPGATQVPVFEPMTNVTSSGGIDSPVKGSPRGKKNRSGKKFSGKSAGGNVYIVKSGDTPERIARRLKVSLSAFMAANNLDQASARRLQIGQKLVIPTGKGAYRTTRRTKKTRTTTKTPAIQDGYYIVQSGDTPERIARRLRVRLSDFLSANNLDQASARRLQIGQKLIIPGKNQTAPKTTNGQGDTNNGQGNTNTNTDGQGNTNTNTDGQGNTNTNTDGQGNTNTDGQGNTNTDGQGNTNTDGQGNTNTNTNTDGQGAGGADDQATELAEVDADCTLEEYARKHNIDPAWLSKYNSGKTTLKKGEMIFVPARPQQ